MTNLILAFDVINCALVSYNGSAGALPSFRRGIYASVIYLVQPNPNSSPTSGGYVAFDPTGFDGLRVGIWPTSAGTDAGNLTLTDQTGWIYTTDSQSNPCFVGNLNVATDAITAFIGTSATKSAFFAVNLVKGADLYPVYDQTNGVANCTILAATDPGSGNGTNMTGAVPTMPLPFQFGPDANGKFWVVDGVSGSPPTLEITCLNP